MQGWAAAKAVQKLRLSPLSWKWIAAEEKEAAAVICNGYISIDELLEV